MIRARKRLCAGMKKNLSIPGFNGFVLLPMAFSFSSKAFPQESTDRFPSYRSAGELFEVLHHWTGDTKYLAPLSGRGGRRTRDAVNRSSLEDSYAATSQYNAQRMYLATEGFPWDDGPYISYGSIVTNRLGGMPIQRGNQFPRHSVSWRFEKPDRAEREGNPLLGSPRSRHREGRCPHTGE